MIGDLSALLDWKQMLSALALYAALSFLLIFTGFLTSKKHSKLSLVLIILLAAIGVYGLVTDSAYFSAVLLGYCLSALAAWIWNNKPLKIIRMILAGIIAAFTLYLSFTFFIGFISALSYTMRSS